MTPTLDLASLTDKKLWELALRFAFGGTITVVTQLIAQAFGPGIAGLFLAFPAILPATLTLIRDHDGARAAGEDARGALLGSVGLALFALCIWRAFAADASAAAALALAALAWLASGTALWWLLLRER
jgi:hypothetical protein